MDSLCKRHRAQKKWRDKNKAYNALRMRKYRKTNSLNVRKYYNKRYKLNKSKILKQCKKSYKRHAAKRLVYAKKYYLKEKLACFNHYSDGDIKCACCGERHIEFLSLDHIFNDGAAHRKLLGSSNRIYAWARLNNYPAIFQVLCMNCNSAKYRFGTCPHQKEKISESIINRK